jgi:hypothetical protein
MRIVSRWWWVYCVAMGGVFIATASLSFAGGGWEKYISFMITYEILRATESTCGAWTVSAWPSTDRVPHRSRSS